MDVVMQYADEYLFDSVYMGISSYTGIPYLERQNPVRVIGSLFVFIMSYIVVFYLGTAGFEYVYIYDKDNMKHPKFLKNQVQMEITTSLKAFPTITVLTIPWIYAEINGYTLLYDDPFKYGIAYLALSAVMFLLFTDFCIYWIHRLLHHPLVYTRFHKLHHKWVVCTPFASHAFDPIDGYLQSLPYHLATLVFPIYKYLYLALFAFVNVWSVMIHDGNYLSNNPIINGAAHHTLHHTRFQYNYGQFTTIFDRLFNSHMRPGPSVYNSSIRKSQANISKETNEIDKMLKVVDATKF
ncbi:C-5 sterol desaturase erg31 [Smittium mucronatum]|uniref:C-5 sterol desaturase erg31 n=1 Tax=Smittium mucronatum TaxID=133383 RepID=A0A1R0H306_9FUNG|nr:C-5 sterol desaturase erg31 [Smittium mucronatum]